MLAVKYLVRRQSCDRKSKPGLIGIDEQQTTGKGDLKRRVRCSWGRNKVMRFSGTWNAGTRDNPAMRLGSTRV